MKQSQIARILKIATVIAAIVMALLFLLYLPLLEYQLAKALDATAAFLPAVAATEGVWVLICLALWQFWNVCRRIGEGNSFCQENARAFRRISRFSGAGTVLVALFGGTVAVLRPLNGAWGLLFFLFLCVGIGVQVLAWCLSHLIGNAAELKEQADLTI